MHGPAPEPATPLRQHLRFGRCEIQPLERRLLVEGEPVALGARAFDLLLALSAQPGTLLTKNQLIETVRPGVVVGEGNLATQISTLRKVLGGDVAASGRWPFRRARCQRRRRVSSAQWRCSSDGERQAVERAAEFDDRRCVGIGQRKAGVGGLRPLAALRRRPMQAMAAYCEAAWHAKFSGEVGLGSKLRAGCRERPRRHGPRHRQW